MVEGTSLKWKIRHCESSDKVLHTYIVENSLNPSRDVNLTFLLVFANDFQSDEKSPYRDSIHLMFVLISFLLN